MIRLALLLRVVPEEGLRNAYANVNPFTKFLTSYLLHQINIMNFLTLKEQKQ